MKKTLIALALTSLPVAAMAEVVLYGQIKGGYEVNSTKITGDVRTPYQNGLADFGSRIGFKGKEDLGNGLNAIWQVENSVSLGGAGTWAARDTFIGLEGGFGKIRAGRLSSFQNSDMGDVDQWEYSSAALGLNKFTRLDSRYVGIRYDSPKFAGFSFAALYAPSDNRTGSTDSTLGGRPHETRDVYNVGLAYENSGFFAKYAYQYEKNTTDSYNGQIHRLEGGYDANNLFVALGYQNSRNVRTYATGSAYLAGVADYFDSNGINPSLATQQQIAAAHKAGEALAAGNVPVRGQEVALTAGYRFGNVFPKMSYAHGWNVKDTVDGATYRNTKYDQIVIGADYDFSKRTSAMVSAGWLREGLGESNSGVSNGKSTTTAFGVGLRHKF